MNTAINIIYANLIIKFGREKADALIAKLHAEVIPKNDYCPSFLRSGPPESGTKRASLNPN
jgi:hypothetical protein